MVIVAFSPGTYVALSNATVTEATAVEPTRIVTGVDLIVDRARVDAFPNVIVAEPAFTPVTVTVADSLA